MSRIRFRNMVESGQKALADESIHDIVCLRENAWDHQEGRNQRKSKHGGRTILELVVGGTGDPELFG